ncbi:MAG: cupin domain-containing protein [Acidimicrobiia bacterium]
MLLATAAVLSAGAASQATPAHGDIHRSDLGRGRHAADAGIAIRSGDETVVYTATVAPGATSGWHRHPGALVVLVKSGTLTSYGLDREPCIGEDIAAGGAYFEDDASKARYPHFVRNRADIPVELVIVAFNVPPGGTSRSDADAPSECPDPQ